MPNPPLGLVRAYINITPEDKATLEKEYGRGWSAQIRDIIHDHCIDLRHEHRSNVLGRNS